MRALGQRVPVSKLVVLVVFAFLVSVPAAHAVLGNSAQPLTGAWVLDAGSAARPAHLECAGTTADGRIVLRNAGDEAAILFFASGESQVLAPGEELAVEEDAAAVIGTHQCVCKCTCTAADGSTEGISFPCDSNTGPDPCPASNGSGCLFADADKEGTLSGCKRWYIPIRPPAPAPAPGQPAGG